jgi:hypothetical protein
MLSESQEKRITQLENYDVNAEEGITLPPEASGQVFKCVRLFLGRLNSLFPSGYAPPATIGCNELKTSASLTWDLDGVLGGVTVTINQLFSNRVDCEILISHATRQNGTGKYFHDKLYDLTTLNQACERIRLLLR